MYSIRNLQDALFPLRSWSSLPHTFRGVPKLHKQPPVQCASESSRLSELHSHTPVPSTQDLMTSSLLRSHPLSFNKDGLPLCEITNCNINSPRFINSHLHLGEISKKVEKFSNFENKKLFQKHSLKFHFKIFQERFLKFHFKIFQERFLKFHFGHLHVNENKIPFS